MANNTAARVAQIMPRFIRAGDAYGYLGMCRAEFDKTVRPNVREFPIGKQGVGFDRVELDQWADAYVESKAIEKALIQGNNRRCSERQQGASPWREKPSQASTKKVESGKSIKSSGASAFEKARALVIGKKPSSI